MIFGNQPMSSDVITSGVFLFAVLVVQVLVGKRIIRFKGRAHARIHKFLGYGLLAAGVLHGVLALAVYEGWRILN